MCSGQKVLNADLLKKVTGEFDLASITELNARSLGVTDLGIIGECTGLIYLDLSGNIISNVCVLESLKNLTTLNLSCNLISTLAGLEGLENLKTLNLAGNVITSIESLHPLVNLEHFRSLQLKDSAKNQYNPVCQTRSNYKTSVCSLLPGLTILDGQKVSGPESEVFQMCDELEQKLDEFEKEEKGNELSKIDSGLEEINKKQKAVMNGSKTEPKVAWSAEQQFRDLLEQCKNLNKDADEAICNAEQALWGAKRENIKK